jgi:cytochrome c
MRTCLRSLSISACVASGLIVGCTSGQSGQPHSETSLDSVKRGRTAIVVYRCGECHTIPGVKGAKGVVGPPLNSLSHRTYIGGNFPNTPDNLAHWVMSPQAMKPKTAMPALGISELQAQYIAAYLDTLK